MISRLTVLSVLAVLLAGPGPAFAGSDIPYWPSEQQQRLREVEHDLLDVQRQLAAARLNNKDEKQVEKLSKRYSEIQDERVKLMRALGDLPAARN
jgi:cob(I)alamin adenosyltransferase